MNISDSVVSMKLTGGVVTGIELEGLPEGGVVPGVEGLPEGGAVLGSVEGLPERGAVPGLAIQNEAIRGINILNISLSVYKIIGCYQ